MPKSDILSKYLLSGDSDDYVLLYADDGGARHYIIAYLPSAVNLFLENQSDEQMLIRHMIEIGVRLVNKPSLTMLKWIHYEFRLKRFSKHLFNPRGLT